MTILDGVVLAGYASLALELTVLHVPSVASSWKIWSSPTAVAQAYSPRFRRVFDLPAWKKVLYFGLPVLVIYAIYLYPLLGVFGAPDPLGDHLFEGSTASAVLAAVLVVAGRAMSLSSVVALRKAHADTDSISLQTRGAFARSRNPNLVGMYVFVSGLWLTGPSITMLVGIVPYVVYMDFKVRMEEDYLQNTLGEEYVAYRQGTRRY